MHWVQYKGRGKLPGVIDLLDEGVVLLPERHGGCGGVAGTWRLCAVS